MLEQQLIESGHFLRLSRVQPDLFCSRFSFRLANATTVNISGPGIIEFIPEKSGDRELVFSCGVHGNETAPIEICDDLVMKLLQGEIHTVHRVLFLFANLPSMDIADRFVEENMNRLFSGAHSQSPGLINSERIRAKELENAVQQFFLAGDKQSERIHYDLHTAIRASKNDKFAVYPFLHGKPRSKEQIAILSACGVNTILLSESPTTTFSYYSTNEFGAHGFTVELGKVRPFGANDMSKFADVKQTMTKLITEKHPRFASFNKDKVEVYRVNQVIDKHQDDFTLHFADDIPNFTDFPKNHVLASEKGAIYRCEYDKEAIVFPNAKVAKGQRALLTVVPTEI